MKRKYFVVVIILNALWLLSGLKVPGAFADSTLSYDPYTPIYEEDALQSPSNFKKALWHLPVFPLELVRWPVDRALISIEKNHLEKKGEWLYDWIKDKGISPKIKATSLSHLGGGAEVEFVRLLRKHEDYPDFKVKGWSYWTAETKRNFGGSLTLDRIGGMPLQFNQIADYEKRPEEHFYGIGSNSSAGDGAVFSMETTTIRTELGYRPTPFWRVDGFASYRNINIRNGRDGGRGIRGETSSFSFDHTPGIDGDSILSTGTEFVLDTRNHLEHSTQGGKDRFALSYNEGLNSSEARYFKYELESSHYFRLGSERRVLALHAYGEHNDEVANGNVPFHQMAKLGGFGANRLSHPLRGYDFNRFFGDSAVLYNVEYRYNIWQYRDIKMDAALFWDQGQVFNEFSEMKWNSFRESYGLGFRVSLASVTLLNIEVAHGDEGTNFYFKTSTPF